MTNIIQLPNLIFYLPNAASITLQKVQFTVIPKTCQISFELSWADYEILDTKEYMNLQRDMRSQLSGPFTQNQNVAIKAFFNPDHFHTLLAKGESAEIIGNTLQQLAEISPDHVVFDTENWMPLFVEQGEVSYTTLFSFLNIEELANAESPEKLISEAMFQFVKQTAFSSLITENDNLNEVDDIPKQFADAAKTAFNFNGNDSTIVNLFKSTLAKELKNTPKDLNNVQTEDLLKDLFTQALEEEFSNMENEEEEEEEDILLQDIVEDFLAEENWPYSFLDNSSDIYVKFTGNKGQWHCFIRTVEKEERFIFYSVIPANIPPPKMAAFVELITRINFNMIIGNFEMDYNTGTLRYKTSIDVQNDGLSVDLVRNHVYANLYTMDHYFPMFRRLLNEDITVAELLNFQKQPQTQTQEQQQVAVV